MTETAVREEILSFLQTEVAYPGTEVTEETNLFDDGVLDSLSILRLVLHLESAYAITFAPEDLSSDAFARVPTLSSLVQARIAAQP